MTDLRAQAIAQITEQFEATPPVSQEWLDAMVKSRREAELPEEVIQELIDGIIIDKTRLILFLLEDEGTPLTILTLPTITIEEAVEALEEIGTFVDSDPDSKLPRLMKRA